jgi:hypothetical protein
MRRWKDRYEDIPGAAGIIEAEVRGWFAQQLVETILGAQALRRSRECDDQAIDRLLSQEALTATPRPLRACGIVELQHLPPPSTYFLMSLLLWPILRSRTDAARCCPRPITTSDLQARGTTGSP